MPRDIDIIFSEITLPSPSAGLADAVFARIARERRRNALVRVVAWIAASAASLLAAVAAWTAIAASVASSGFDGFASVAVSDAGQAFADWQSFGWALLESFPVLEVAAFLAALLVLLEILKQVARGLKDMRTPLGVH